MVINKRLVNLHKELSSINTKIIMYAHRDTRMYQKLTKRKQDIKREIIKIKQQPFLKEF
ncbi:hypothetical protein [Fructilactobacillus sanfranciscensis]|uniref:hypothetical protein n=1 Tax=Fructilactobacillus sanfranciscensis TaxID=1625 RepID=UPI0013D841FD|nr:hypothetical protein [Fructilactobacillus sanfranciscensis]